MSDNIAVDAPANGTSVVTIIKDGTARWVVIVGLAFAVAYALLGERANHEAAMHAQMDADLAKYYATDLKVYMGMQGMRPPSEPWNKSKEHNK